MQRIISFFIGGLLVLAMGLVGVSTPVHAQTPQPTPEITGTADFTGTVTMTGGESVPEGLEVILEAYDMQLGLLWNGRAPVAADGSFSFTDVPLSNGRVFAGYIVYKGVDFTSDQGMLGITDSPINPGDVVQLTFTLSEPSNDTSVLEATRLHLIIDPLNSDTLQVSLWYVIDNPTSQVVAAATPGQPVLRFSVPEGTTDLQFSETTDTSTLIGTADGFGDTAGIQPGSNYQMFYMVEMTYKDQGEFILPVHLPVGQAIIMLPANGLELSGDGLTDNGVRTMPDGTSLQVYTTAPIPAEGTLRFTFGKPPEVSPILIGGFALGSALIVVLAWWWTSRRKRAAEADSKAGELAPASGDEPQDMDDLLDSIVALDDLYRSGEIEEAAYQQRRAELKERVRILKETHAGK